MKPAVTFVGLLVASLVIPGGADDFRLDRLAAQAIWQGGDPYYPFAGFTHVRLPAAHLLQLPVGLIPVGWAHFGSAIMVAVGGTLLVWVGFRRWWWAAPFVLLVWPFHEVDRHGHPTFWWTALLILGARQIGRRPWLAGLCLAAATSFRLFPWVIILGLAIAGEWREVRWSAGWFAALNVVGLALPGVTVAGTVAALSDGAGLFLEHPGNLSMARLFPVWTLIIPVVVFVWWAWGRDWQTIWGPSVAVSLIAGPLVWATYLPTLLAWRTNYGVAHFTPSAPVESAVNT